MIRLLYFVFIFFIGACSSIGDSSLYGSQYELNNVANIENSDYKFNYPQGWTVRNVDGVKSTVVTDGIHTCDVNIMKNQDRPEIKNISEQQRLAISKSLMSQVLGNIKTNEDNLKVSKIDDNVIEFDNIKGFFITVEKDINIKNSNANLKMPVISYMFSNIKNAMFTTRCSTVGGENSEMKKLVIDIARTVSRI